MFGRDPFEPVTCSSIRQMIESGTPVTVVSEMAQWRPCPGIMVYDASTDRELTEAGRFLMEAGELHIMAGCAGFAGVLPDLLHLNGRADRKIRLTEPFFVACGSVNPITRSQLDFAQKRGCGRIRLTPPQKLEQGYYETAEGKYFLDEWARRAAGQKMCMLDTNDPPGGGETLEYARERGISLEDLRVRISSTLGYILKELLERGLGGTLLITGGDCLTGFMKHIGCETIAPVCEMAPGTVLSEIELQGRRLGVISKSGGFGPETLLMDLARKIEGKEEEKSYADKL